MRVQYQVGDTTVEGYLAVPASGRGPGVLVFPTWWGLNPFFEDLCERLAAEGFVAFAPDYYGGNVATTPDEASKLADALDWDFVKLQAQASVAFLQVHPATRGGKIGVMGFSLGVAMALGLSGAALDQVAAVVIFYGAGMLDFTASPVVYLGHFAEDDQYEDADYIAATYDALVALGQEVTFHTYPGTGHWFFESDVASAYNPAAAELAWSRTLEFLRAHLA